MRPSPLGHLRRLPLALLLAGCVAVPAQAQEPDLAAHVAKLKEAQVRFMMRGAQRRIDRHRLRARDARGQRRLGPRPIPVAAGLRRQPAIAPGTPAPSPAPAAAADQAPAGLAAIAPNVLVNNRAGDSFGSGQCEVSIAAHGNNLVAAWNDGQGFSQGYAYSTNNGANWVDGGVPPTTNVGTWISDPVVSVNEKTGAFYFSALCDPSGTTNGIGVVKGTFNAGVFTWGTPQVAIAGSYSTVLYDKEWFVADSSSNNLYLIYTRFTVTGGQLSSSQIDFQRSTNDNVSWSGPTTLSDPGDAGRVQGSRIAVGPGGEVWASWNAIGKGIPTEPTNEDHMRIRQLANGGTVVGAHVTAVSQYTNWGTGAPGFNRGGGFAFPGLAVDRGTGPRRGRVYLTWNESVNFYDPIGTGSTVNESEPNDTPGQGDAFSMSQVLNGTISSTADVDCWSFTGTQGQTIICDVDPHDILAPNLDVAFRLLCGDQTTRLAYSESGPGGYGLVVFTLPADGPYTLRVESIPPDIFTPPGTGPYTIRTVTNSGTGERARDHRDVFTTYSDAIGTWSTPARINGDPGYYDNWLPEVAVAPNGDVYAAWYDWRDTPEAACGGASMVYLSRSTNGAASWSDGSPVSSALTHWTLTATNIAPNQGDYISLFANQNAVYACWSDGRNGDPDVYMATVPLAFTAAQVSLAGTFAEPGLVRITWFAAGAFDATATVYRRDGDAAAWRDVGQVSPDGTGRWVFEDRSVTAGARYHYRLGLRDGEGETFSDEVLIEVPAGPAAALAIQQVHPNPTPREVWVSFSLPEDAAATLELIDVSGRRVRERAVAGAGRQMVDLAAGARLSPGVYLVRLAQGRRSVVTRVSVVR